MLLLPKDAAYICITTPRNFAALSPLSTRPAKTKEDHMKFVQTPPLPVKVLTLFVIVLTPTLAQNVLAAGKQYVYARSQTQSNSPTMGVAGVPAFVLMSNGQRRGVYITKAGTSGYWRSIGLRPGYVLLTLDNKVIESADDIESYLMSKNPSAQIGYTYAAIAGGQPRLVSGQMNYTGKHQEGVVGYAQVPGSGRAVVGPSSSASDHVQDNSSIGDLESHMIKLINRDRAANGLGSVSESSRLSSLARSYAEYMLNTNSMSHIDGNGKNPNDRANEAGIKCGVAENLSTASRGYGTDKSAVERAQATMYGERPPNDGHRQNILSPSAQYVGVGIARNGKRITMVQEYTDTSP